MLSLLSLRGILVRFKIGYVVGEILDSSLVFSHESWFWCGSAKTRLRTGTGVLTGPPGCLKFRTPEQSPTTPDSSRHSASPVGQNPGKVYLLRTFNILNEASRYLIPDPTFSQIARGMLGCRRSFSDLNACGSLYKPRFFPRWIEK
jgi:hypothetical protein